MTRSGEIELGPAHHTVPSDQRQILCLSGGGYRGLYTALVLEELEAKAKRPLQNVFDVISGTSVGGLIAAGLAMKIPAREIRAGIEKYGESIFDRRIGFGGVRIGVTNPLKSLYRAKYPQRPLRRAIDAIFEQTATNALDSIETPLLLVAVNTRTGAPLLIRSNGLAGGSASRLTLRDSLLATAAAPTFFPPHRAGGDTYVDGGLIANAPDLVAVTETIKNLGCDAQDLRVLSVGTASTPHEISSMGHAPGLLSWLIARGLVQLTLSAQEELAVDQCKVLLGDRYLRLDTNPPAADQTKIGLDKADTAATKVLMEAAKLTVETFRGEHRAAIRRFLSHQAQGPRRAPIS